MEWVGFVGEGEGRVDVWVGGCVGGFGLNGGRRMSRCRGEVSGSESGLVGGRCNRWVGNGEMGGLATGEVGWQRRSGWERCVGR